MEHELRAWHAIDKLRSIIESRLVVGAILDQPGDKLVALHEELDKYTKDPNVFFKIKTIYHTTDFLTLLDKRGCWDFDLEFETTTMRSQMFHVDSPVAVYTEKRIRKTPGWLDNKEILITLKGPNWGIIFKFYFTIERNRFPNHFDKPFELCLRLKNDIIYLDGILQRFSTISELVEGDKAVLSSKDNLMDAMISKIKVELNKRYVDSWFREAEEKLKKRREQIAREEEQEAAERKKRRGIRGGLVH